MDYIDTDVLVHFLITQDPVWHLKAVDTINEMIIEDRFFISWLTIQEIAFVLGKLNQPNSFIQLKLNSLIENNPVQYGVFEVKRAMALAEIVGFKNFNDCLHLAIAEQHCTNFYTCNYKDFKNLKEHTLLNIHFFNNQRA